MSRPLKKSHRKTVALVLGSGASRGWAHIGVIEEGYTSVKEKMEDIKALLEIPNTCIPK